MALKTIRCAWGKGAGGAATRSASFADWSMVVLWAAYAGCALPEWALEVARRS